MKLLKSVALTIIVTVLFTSCNPSSYERSSSCPVVTGVPTSFVTGPTEANINEEITLNVSYKTKSDCSEFFNFHTQGLANQRTIGVNVMYDACACQDETVTTEVELFKFKESEAGLYVLKFRAANDLYVVHNITVSEAEN